ncbi:hypothetical protein HDU98_001002 [Podochytrium sp. JEL0797]|nr:hypothetical protein HDU98_001002 [Podochytrium sp. JEL0797]
MSTTEKPEATAVVVTETEAAGPVVAVVEIPVLAEASAETSPATTSAAETLTTDGDSTDLGFDPSSIITQVAEPAKKESVHHHPHTLPKALASSAAKSNKVSPMGDSDKKNPNGMFDQFKALCCACGVHEDASEREPIYTTKKAESVSSVGQVDIPLVMTSDIVKKKESKISVVESVLEEDAQIDPQHELPTKADASPSPVSEYGDHKFLLPKILREDVGKKLLILDLDETLVHSAFKPVANADFIIPIDIEGQFHNVYVLKRPNVDSFLENLGTHFEVAVFTASMSNYANPVLDLLDRKKVIKHRLFREHCTFTEGSFVKDLTLLGRPIEDCIIVDNSPVAYAFQPENAVPCAS